MTKVELEKIITHTIDEIIEHEAIWYATGDVAARVKIDNMQRLNTQYIEQYAGIILKEWGLAH